MTQEAKLAIAGLIFELRNAGERPEFTIHSPYLPFLVEDGEPDFTLAVHPGGIPDWEGELIFDSEGPWKLWRQDGNYVFSLHNPLMLDGAPYQIAIIDPGFTHGDTYIHPELMTAVPDYFPLSAPLDEILVLNRLALGSGLEIHACGINDNGRGYLFAGVSGAGKSTTARFWERHEGVQILSDDRIIIRLGEGGFRLYGTPWHGDAGLSEQAQVSLEAVFFIQHAAENWAKPLGAGALATRILARSFPTFWRREGMTFCLDLAAQVAEAVPGYELGFVPQAEVVGYVRDLLAERETS